MGRRLVAGVAVLVMAALLAPGPAGAGGVAREITMVDDRFVPADAVVAQGRPVEFQNLGQTAHDAADGTGLDLFATDLLAPPEAETVEPLPGAGNFRYYCSFHPGMVGRLRVPLRASHARRPVGRLVTIRWAAERAPAGLVFDVQRRRPGTIRFAAWHTGVPGMKSTFRPGRRGNWAFRARVRRPATGAVSGWSPVRLLRVV